MNDVIDGFGRRFHYLRLSVTEVCNFCCTYCLPDGFKKTAPLTFLRALQADDPNKGGLLRLLNVDIGLILHGEQHFEYFSPVVVGDVVTCQEKVVDIYDKKGGALWFVVQEMEMKDQAGKLLAKGGGVTVVRNPDAAKK